jgi:hypothetical protein
MGGGAKLIDKVIKETFGGAMEAADTTTKVAGDIIQKKAEQLDPRNIVRTTGDALMADIPMFQRIEQDQGNKQGENIIDWAGAAGIDPNATTEEEDEDQPTFDPLLGRLAAGRRTLGTGKGIGANILTSGAGLAGKAKTQRKTLLG